MWTDVAVVALGWVLSLVTLVRGGYDITVTTGSRSRAGTDAVMNYRLQGTNGDSGTRVLPGQNIDMFEKNSVDELYVPEDFGVLKVVTFGHDNTGNNPDWYFDKVNFHDRLRGYDYEFVCSCYIPTVPSNDYYKSMNNSGRTMNISETVLRWEASLCHTNQEPQVYHLDHEIEENVTGLLSDGLPQTCQPLFPPGTSFANNVMFIHRIPPIRLPRLNVIGRYTDCSPISGLLVYAMDDSGVLRPCTSYIGVNVGDFTTCRFLCDIDGLVSYIVIGISGRRALTMSETAAICEIAVV